MKVGIFTINGIPNFGNRLQNYAMQKVLKDLGFESETIINKTNVPRCTKTTKELFFEGSLNDKLRLIKTKLSVEKNRELNEKRAERFALFAEKYIKEMDTSIELGKVPNDFHKRCDYFIAGSDQVWNPHIPAVSEISFLTFAPVEKRITYAPSFGVSKIPEEYKNDYKKWLGEIEDISVREDDGAKIVEELTGKKAIVHVDPTMLLTKNEWLDISKVAEEKPSKKYILTYFLGDIASNVKKKMKEIEKKYNLEVINLASEKDKNYYLTDPSEFIDYINNAEVFITDSFHGCVFSVLLETPFIVCDRQGQDQKMNSRIDTLLETFKLQSRRFVNVTDETLFLTDYKEANKVLEVEREKSKAYLKKILKIKN